MKNLKTLLLIAVFTLGVGGVANAQKVGHIDFAKLVADMPQTKTLQANIEKLGKTYKTEIDEMKSKLDTKIKKYSAEQKTQTKETNDKRALEVQQLGQQYEQARQLAMQEMQKQEREGLNPILEKAQKAIQDVAAEKGIEYVLDSTPGKGVLVKKGIDLMAAVKIKLGF